jgi:predicted DNA-binding ArsR family transcriptional regulator
MQSVGKPFMYKTKEDDMIVVSLGYSNYVLSNKDAVALAEILEKAELYESIWIPSGERNGGPDHTHHVYENDKQIDMKLISTDLYRMAKLAGRPEKK